MNQRVVTGLLAAGCIALVGAGYMTYKNQDRTAPKIKVDKSEKITYTEGEDYGKLLKGVTAQDNKDGDLTSQVFVDKVVPISKKKAVVYYGVTDKANNVGTANREVKYQEAEPDTADTDAADTNAAEDTSGEKKKTTKKAKTKKKKTDNKKKEESKAQEQTDSQQTEEQTNDTLQPNGTRPAIKLVENAKTIARGTTFNALNEVADAVDDKDDRDTLFRGLHVDGNYNVNQAGTYTLQYYVQDSEGNASDPVTFTLTVQ